MLTDFIAFEKAYAVAVKFAEADGDTLVLAFPDHNTGGLTIGHRDAAPAFTSTNIDDLLSPLRLMDLAGPRMATLAKMYHLGYMGISKAFGVVRAGPECCREPGVACWRRGTAHQ